MTSNPAFTFAKWSNECIEIGEDSDYFLVSKQDYRGAFDAAIIIYAHLTMTIGDDQIFKKVSIDDIEKNLFMKNYTIRYKFNGEEEFLPTEDGHPYWCYQVFN